MMTESEAIKVLKNITEHTWVGDDDWVMDSAFAKAYEIAITALEEIQKYKDIGTVEELKTLHNDYWKLNEICKEYSAIGTVSELRENKNFLEFLYNTILPNEMEQYLAMYHTKELKGE